MKQLRIEYKKSGQLLTRGLKMPIGDNLTTEEIREIVLDQILGDLDVIRYSWEVMDND